MSKVVPRRRQLVVFHECFFVSCYCFCFLITASHLQLCFNATKHKQKQNYKNVQLAQVVSHYSFSARPGRNTVSASATDDSDDDDAAAAAAPRNKKVTVRVWSENRSVRIQLENRTRECFIYEWKEASRNEEERKKQKVKGNLKNTFAIAQCVCNVASFSSFSVFVSTFATLMSCEGAK